MSWDSPNINVSSIYPLIVTPYVSLRKAKGTFNNFMKMRGPELNPFGKQVYSYSTFSNSNLKYLQHLSAIA
jgi:hypothetical protein